MISWFLAYIFRGKQKVFSAYTQHGGLFRILLFSPNVTRNTQSESPNIDLGGCFLALNTNKAGIDSVIPYRVQIRLLGQTSDLMERVQASHHCDPCTAPPSFQNLTYGKLLA